MNETSEHYLNTEVRISLTVGEIGLEIAFVTV